MTRQYSVEQAQEQFAHILQTVEKGETVEIICQDGKAAVLISMEKYNQLISKPLDFWQALQKFRQQVNLEQIGLESEDFQEVQDKSPGREPAS